MKTFNIVISSKNQDSLNKFIYVFFKNTYLNFNIIKRSFKKKKRKIVLTLLKSPHVNKKAQEQFETRFFSKEFKIQVFQNFKFLIFLKKLKKHLFPDIKTKIKFATNNKKLCIKVFNPNNFVIQKNNVNHYQLHASLKKQKIQIRNFKNSNSLSKKIKNLLNIFHNYGKILKM